MISWFSKRLADLLAIFGYIIVWVFAKWDEREYWQIILIVIVTVTIVLIIVKFFIKLIF